jgi:O-acetyl-ADP-ribose deacetylase (regulator of RNase III)
MHNRQSIFSTDGMQAMTQIRAQINETVVELTQGDITKEDTDAIVNAANSSLLGGGGVDGAIHRAAGSELLAETRTLGGCQTGDAKITKGYRLKAKHVIHTVGPIYRRGDATVPALLMSAYRRSLEVAEENGVRSIAFPAISTGIYGYPLEEASEIALGTACDFAAASNSIQLMRFVQFSQEAFDVYQDTLNRLVSQRDDLQFIE